MKKYLVLQIAVLLALLLGALAPQFAQNVPTGPRETNEDRRATAVGLVSTIDTAEVLELNTYGSFASWQTLLEHQAEYLNKHMRKTGVQLSPMPGILPGWSLRLNVRGDGRAFDVMLEDITNTQTPYAAYGNETGIIWNAAPSQ